MHSVWWLYLLTFAFGYYTCRTFYFFREMRTGLILLKLSHALSLYLIVRGLENLQYTKSTRVKEMHRAGDLERNIDAFTFNFDREIALYKQNAIRDIINNHPRFYKDIIAFDDWESAMVYLNIEGREYINKFNKKDS